MEGFSCTAFSTEAAYPRIFCAQPGLTLAMIVKPLAGVLGIIDPNFPFSPVSCFLGNAAASGFIVVSFPPSLSVGASSIGCSCGAAVGEQQCNGIFVTQSHGECHT